MSWVWEEGSKLKALCSRDFSAWCSVVRVVSAYSSDMTKNLPPRLRDLFAPRPPLEYLSPPGLRKMPAYTGLGDFVTRLKDPENAPAPSGEPIEILKPSEIREKKRKRAIEDHEVESSKKAKLCTLLPLQNHARYTTSKHSNATKSILARLTSIYAQSLTFQF